MMKFAVIGCGNIAQKSAIPALMTSGVSSVSVCIDIETSRGIEIKNIFNLPFETSFQKAVVEYDFDAVYISTPIGTHKDLIIQSANHKKDILCEKSLAVNLQEVIEIVEICKRNNVALFEGFMYQFHTQHQFVRDIIAKSEIGVPFHFQAWFGFPPISENDFRYKKQLGGGAVLDAGAYTIHYARHFFGCEPINVFSTLEEEDHEVEIRGTAMLDFGDSRTAHLVFGFNNMYQNTYKIWGTKGVISLERAFAVPPDYKSLLTIEKQGLKKDIAMQACNHFKEEVKYFCENVKETRIRKSWFNEIVNQAMSLEKLR